MKINKEIKAKVDRKIAEENYINRCFAVNFCPDGGQDLHDKDSVCKNGDE